ncbi:hypothetical protein [Arthrobacter sp. Hiyo1]|uniref:hypothetical protein n=1 Tax=Arthrobacter sp. Hiyo1 TaxID=1588020 RepID=UPI0011E4D3B3|nr:hypothetical protein [Arthrobacter sp. Hiyo1]
MKDKTELEAVSYLIDFVKKHLVSGKVNLLDDDGKTVLGELLPEDVDASKDLVDKLFSEIVGVSLDPKALSTATETSPTSEPTTAL